MAPFFSPDGAWLGFFTPDSLKKVALVGGPPVTLSSIGSTRAGATWGPDDTVVFASDDAPGLMQVPAAGGEPRPLTEPAENTTYAWPTFVPGGEAVLYTLRQGPFDDFEVAVVSLDTGAQRSLVRGTDATVTTSGHRVFGREASLWAVPFDADQLTVSGEPTPMVDGVQVFSGGFAQYALATDGTLVYEPARGQGAGGSLVWVDRATGEEPPLALPSRPYVQSRISPDGTRVAVEIVDQQQDIWVSDLTGETQTLTRLTFDAARERLGDWTPDGQRVIFSSERAGPGSLFGRAADGTGTAEPLGESERLRLPQAAAPDGSVVLVQEGGTSPDLITVAMNGDPVSKDLLLTGSDERNAVFSPDGRWFAYESDASGVNEVYVRPFPDADAAVYQISTNGGATPLWAPDGDELFYHDASEHLLAVPVQTAPTFSRGTPAVVLEGRYQLSGFAGRRYDIDPSGERFLLIKYGALGTDSPSFSSLTFVLNWHQELLERVPLPYPARLLAMLRVIIDVLLNAGLLYVLASVLPGVRMRSFGTAVIVALVYGVLSYLLFWMLALIAFIPMLLSLGLFGLVINTFLLWLTDKLVDDFEIRSLGMTFLMAFFLTLGRIAVRVIL